MALQAACRRVATAVSVGFLVVPQKPQLQWARGGHRSAMCALFACRDAEFGRNGTQVEPREPRWEAPVDPERAGELRSLWAHLSVSH